MLQSIERYMKQAIVDKEPSVSSAALTSSLVCSFIYVILSLSVFFCCSLTSSLIVLDRWSFWQCTKGYDITLLIN